MVYRLDSIQQSKQQLQQPTEQPHHLMDGQLQEQQVIQQPEDNKNNSILPWSKLMKNVNWMQKIGL